LEGQRLHQQQPAHGQLAARRGQLGATQHLLPLAQGGEPAVKDQPITQPEPFDPDNAVQWAEGFMEARCGLRNDGKIGPGYCGKKFKFRGCRIMGKLWVASVCNACSLKYDVVTAQGWLEPLRGQKLQYAEELAELLGCTPDQAAMEAYRYFGHLLRKANLKPKPS
jgi:hypothetical protein